MADKIERKPVEISRNSGGGIKRVKPTIKQMGEPDLMTMFEDEDNNPVEFVDTGIFKEI